MSHTPNSEELKQRVRERYKKEISSPPCLDIDGLRVAVYRRTSPQPFEQITSHELVVQYYQNYARSHNWILKGVYIDEGREDHTALDKLLNDCEEIDLVLIRSISHVSYDMDKALEITKKIEARSAIVYFEGENILGSAEWERIHLPVLPPTGRWETRNKKQTKPAE